MLKRTSSGCEGQRSNSAARPGALGSTLLAAALLAGAGALGCATARPARPGDLAKAPAPDRSAPRSAVAAAQPPPASGDRLAPVLAAARAQVGKDEPEIEGKPLPRDCAKFVGALFATAGVDLFAEARGEGGVRALYRYVQRRGQLRRGAPSAGDLVFFDNSYDRNHDGKLNDRLTHVGVVDEVRPDGTAFVIHSTNHGIAREPMNLRSPHASAGAGGERINAVLRRRRPGEPARLAHRHLMAELFAGFGSVLPAPRGASRGRAKVPAPRPARAAAAR